MVEQDEPTHPKSFQRGTVMITGSQGFIGSAISKELRHEGYKVLSYDIKDRNDILNRTAVQEYISWHKPDYIIHLAGRLGTDNLNLDGYNAVISNIIGGINILDAIRFG